MMVTVLLLAGGACLAADFGAVFGRGRSCARLLFVRRLRLTDRDAGDRLAAERIVVEEGEAEEGDQEQAQQHGQRLHCR